MPHDTIAIDPKAKALQLARDAFEKAGGYRESAYEILHEAIFNCKAFYRELSEHLVDEHLRILIMNIAAEQKARIARASSVDYTHEHPGFGGHPSNETQVAIAANPAGETEIPLKPSWTVSPPSDLSGDRIFAARRNNETIFDYQLYGGCKIGEATLTELGADKRFRLTRRANDKQKIALAEWCCEKLREKPAGTKLQDIVSQESLRAKFAQLGIQS